MLLDLELGDDLLLGERVEDDGDDLPLRMIGELLELLLDIIN
tara:strand:- start:3415 stop:3540 length:126 start_codon:yes stop_codon:yes gene_type:complete